MRLEGKVAIITGSAYGMGRGIARRFAAEGARVALLDVDEARNAETERLIREADGEAFTRRCDVSQRAEVEASVAETVERYGKLDIMVANAGISTPTPFLDLTDEIWDRMQAINLKGVFLCCQAAARQMVKQGHGGKIISTASINAEVAGTNNAHYSAAKGGVRMLTKAMAVELAHYQINVNCIAPGIIQTGLSEHRLAQPEQVERYRQIVPWGRVGQPDEIAGAALYLASADSSYVTGVMLVVDGGWTLS
jgi:NAD(P)-dependent dehydrogenase (short-subunit alcohol dehydrogenase family)